MIASPGAHERIDHTTQHADLGTTSWFAVRAGDQTAPRGAWQHTGLPAHASELQGDIRRTSRKLVVTHGERVVADATRAHVLCESGFAPRWYVPRDDIDVSALTPVETQTFCPYKGICSYYDIGDARLAAWSYAEAYAEVGRISDFFSFEPDKISVHLGDKQLHLEPGQTVIPHGVDRELTIAEVSPSHKR
ncbi:DUF427 domain-containing protein [Paraburkholderia phymatum]